uniref:Uncharacterized protein n=1 Tax=Planktothrix agardhii TaxID=1160 RepID=A0A1J1JKI2_PLAAG|nr:protein of unknown function [Planktothrix agardhii]
MAHKTLSRFIKNQLGQAVNNPVDVFLLYAKITFLANQTLKP